MKGMKIVVLLAVTALLLGITADYSRAADTKQKGGLAKSLSAELKKPSQQILLGEATGIERGKKEYIGAYIYEYKKPPQGGSPPYHHIYILEIKEDGSYRLTSGTIVPPEWQYLWQPKIKNGNWEVVTKEEQEREIRELGIPREEIEREMGRIEEVIWFSPPLPVEPAPVGGIWSFIKKGNKFISSASTIEFFPQTADIAFVKKESIEEIERYRRQIESTVERKEEPKPQIAGYTAKFNNLNSFLGSMRGEVLKCPKEKESCNDYEEEAAKVLISHLLTKKSGEWLYGYLLEKMTWDVVKNLILSGLDEVRQMGISAGEAVIKEKITEIKEKMKEEKFEKTHGAKTELVSLQWKDIGVLPIYLPYKERDGRYGKVDGEALMVFYSPQSISFKEINDQVKARGSFWGSFYVLPTGLYGKLRTLPDEGTVRPFKLIIRGTVYEVGEVGTRETWGETIKGPWVTFLEDKSVTKDIFVKPTVIEKPVITKIEGKYFSQDYPEDYLELKRDRTAIWDSHYYVCGLPPDDIYWRLSDKRDAVELYSRTERQWKREFLIKGNGILVRSLDGTAWVKEGARYSFSQEEVSGTYKSCLGKMMVPVPRFKEEPTGSFRAGSPMYPNRLELRSDGTAIMIAEWMIDAIGYGRWEIKDNLIRIKLEERAWGKEEHIFRVLDGNTLIQEKDIMYIDWIKQKEQTMSTAKEE